MITLYTWKTPNGRKPAIMLEELGWEYRVKSIDISKDEQFAPDFLKVSPNNRSRRLSMTRLKAGRSRSSKAARS